MNLSEITLNPEYENEIEYIQEDILTLWKDKMRQALLMSYGQGVIPGEIIERDLNKIIANAKKPIMRMRNVYKKELFDIPLNDLYKIIRENRLIIGANGCLTYRQDIKKADTSDVLDRQMKERKVFKKKAITAQSEGDFEKAKYYDNIQNHKKQNTNSFYGIMVQNGSYLNSPDTASLITGQARQLISEVMWVVERFLEGNMKFQNINEYILYVTNLCNSKIPDDFKSYITYIPTTEDVKKRFQEYISEIPEESRKNMSNFIFSQFAMLEKMSEDTRILYYYKNNIYTLLEKNPKVMALLDSVYASDKQFLAPEPGAKDKDGNYLMDPIVQEKLDLLFEILKVYVIDNEPVYNRVEKYKTRGRKSIIISDTDSIMIHLDPWYKKTTKLSSVEINKDNEQDTFRVINSASYLCTIACNYASFRLGKKCFIPKEYRERQTIKNEFLFTSVIIYPSARKNYSAYCRIREGEIVSNIANTGINITSSAKNQDVTNELIDIIETEIHKSKHINPMKIMSRIYNLRDKIKNDILSGKTALGIYSSYKGTASYNDFMRYGVARGVYIWNALYPDEQVLANNKVNVFDTSFYTADDIEKCDAPDDVKERLRELFQDPKMARYGLRMISIPNERETIPEWLIPFVRVEQLVEKHLTPISNLLPSIQVYNSRLSSTRSHVSSLINF